MNIDDKQDTSTSHWITCDECGQWRRLPPHAALPPEGVTWFCQQNTDPHFRSCSVPEETSGQDEVIKAELTTYSPPRRRPLARILDPHVLI